MTETSRVKEADRDAVIEALTGALVDGQLTPEQHDKRVSAALRARRIGTLGRLLEGVQLADDHPVAPLVAVATFAPMKREIPEQPAAKRDKRWTTKAKIALCAPVVLAVALVVGFNLGSDEPASPPDNLSVAGIEQLVADVEEEFGSTEVVSIEVTEDYVSVLVPSDSGEGRFERYSYRTDLGFSPGLGGTIKDIDLAVIDLADLDADVVMGRVEEARSDLGVEDVSEVRVVVSDTQQGTAFAQEFAGEDVPPHVEVDVSNDFQEAAWLATDLSGDQVLGQERYTSPK